MDLHHPWPGLNQIFQTYSQMLCWDDVFFATYSTKSPTDVP
jgi:hypothetical protein